MLTFVLLLSSIVWTHIVHSALAINNRLIERELDRQENELDELDNLHFDRSNIGRIAFGYDILKGNPLTSHDTGRKSRVFELTDVEGTGQPDHVDTQDEHACSMEDTYSEITGRNSYLSSLKETAEISGSIGGFEFSASDEFQHISNETSSKQSIFISSHIQCSVYVANMENYQYLPDFSPGFKDSVLYDLPLKWDVRDASIVEAFFDPSIGFISVYGTHYIDKMQMGGRYGSTSTFTASSYSKMKETSFDLKTAAKYTTISKSAASASLTDDEKKIVSTFSEATDKNVETFMIGGDLPVDGDENEWYNSLQKSSMPIHYEFQPIYSLLSDHHFPDDPDISKKKSALIDAVAAYCSVLNNTHGDYYGKLECNEYGPDPALPLPRIFKGVYSVATATKKSASGWSMPNPYTTQFNCPNGYEPITYFRIQKSIWHQIIIDDYHLYYCLENNIFEEHGKSDPLKQFGGFYSACRRESSQQYDVCMNGNKFADGKCGCPAGYASHNVREANLNMLYDKNLVPSECVHKWKHPVQYVIYTQTIWCYRIPKNNNYESMTIGGTYTTCPNSEERTDNPLTKATSCPEGFNGHIMSKYFRGYDGIQCDTHMCLHTLY